MPKMKTNRSVAKRFRQTASGKLKAKRCGLRHNLSNKSSQVKRKLNQPTFVDSADEKRFKRALPYGA